MPDAEPESPQPLPRWVAALAAGVFALAGFGLTLFLTGGDNQRADADSLAYLDGAYFMRHGLGYIGRTFPSSTQTTPITHWPPGYAAAIAAAATVTGDEAAAARWLNALLYAMLILAVGHLVWHAGRNLGAMALACGLCLFYWPFIKVHVFIWSEPLFLVATAYALMGAWEYLRSGGKRWLAQAVAAAALAAMTRYAGVAVIAAVGACIALLEKSPLRRRLGKAALASALAAAPAALWALRNLLVAGSVANRSAGFDLPDVKLANASRTVLNWAIPEPWKLPQGLVWLLLACLVAVLGAALWWWIQRSRRTDERPDEARRLVLCCLIFSGAYGAMLLAAVTFADPSIPMTDRILCPLLLLAIVGGGAALARAMAGGVGVRGAAFGLGLLFLALTAYRGAAYAADLRAGGEHNEELTVRRELWEGAKGLR